MTAEREMTLHEWVGKLPEIHLARKELVAMQERIAALEALVASFDAVDKARINEIAALKAELARAQWALVKECTGVGRVAYITKEDGEKAQARYKREIAQQGEEGKQSPDIGPHERAGCSPWNCWLKDGTKCTVLED